jgi:hypothetical protein
LSFIIRSEMSDAPTALPDARLLDRQLLLLGRLAEAGLEVALACERQAKAAEPGTGADLEGLARAYARACGRVRQAVMLQSRLVKAAREAGSEAEAGARAAAEQEAQALRAREEIASGDFGEPLAASARPPPLAGEVAQRAGGGIPPPLTL